MVIALPTVELHVPGARSLTDKRMVCCGAARTEVEFLT